MNTSPLVLPLACGLLLLGCSESHKVTNAPPSPPAKLVADGWKASWSPDGQQLVYGKGQGLGLYRFDLATQQSTPLITGGKDAAWSPDGRWIAFVREESYNQYLTEQVWVVNPNGQDAHRVVQGGFPSWSRDGKRLFVHSRQENQVLAVDPANTNLPPTVICSNTPAWYFSVSPDQNRIAFGCAGRLEVRDRASGKPVATWPTPQDGGLLPAWSPDGKFIAFGGFDSSQLGLWLLEVATLKAARVSEGHYTMPAWNQDGTRLAFDSRDRDRAIWTVDRPYLEVCLRDAKTAPPPTPVARQDESRSAPASTSTLLGKPAPDFSLRSPEDAPVALAALKGNVVVVDFWATWCPPCRKSLPHLQHLSQDAARQKQGLKVIAIDLREPKAKVKEFLTQNDFGFTVGLDIDGAVGEKYLVRGIPTTVVIDAAGIIRSVFVGFSDGSEKELAEAVDRILSRGAARP